MFFKEWRRKRRLFKVSQMLPNKKGLIFKPFWYGGLNVDLANKKEKISGFNVASFHQDWVYISLENLCNGGFRGRVRLMLGNSVDYSGENNLMWEVGDDGIKKIECDKKLFE